MSLKQIGEFGFIDKISRGCLICPEGIARAIGDDAAAFGMEVGRLALITTDLLVERVHFLRTAVSGFDLGYKCLAVNLSDIAAMGGEARQAFVSIAIPADCSLVYLEDLYEGMKQLAAEFDVNILGGDTTGSKTDLIVNVAVYGTVPADELLARDAARPGDILFSTGYLGDSRAGLHLILNGIEADDPHLQSLYRAHVRPPPHLREGRFLAARSGVHAAIDTSDGLSSDLGHIARQSRVGAILQADRLPISDALKAFCRRFDFDPVQFALAGGEDYTLLCTSDADQAAALEKDFESRFKRPLFRIGRINAGQRLEMEYPDGRIASITASGWDHFKTCSNEDSE